MPLAPNTLAAAITAAAVSIAEGRSALELAVLASAFNQIGDTLGTIAAQRDVIEARAAAGQTQPAPGRTR